MGWESLLEHCRGLEQTVPGEKWKKKSRELIASLGEGSALAAMLRWLALGPTPGQPPEARSPIEDSPYQKGVIWCLALSHERDPAIAIADFGIALAASAAADRRIKGRIRLHQRLGRDGVGRGGGPAHTSARQS